MGNVNFGLLQAIQPGGVVGSVPGTAPSNSMDSLAGGIMSGLQQGQQIGLNAQQKQMNDQRMKFDEQNNPALIEQNKNVAASSGIDLQNKQLAQQQLQERTVAAKQGYDKYIQTVAAQDPAAAIQIQKSKLDYETSISQSAAIMSKNKTEELNNQFQLQEGGGNLASIAIQGGTNPQTGQVDWAKANQVYQSQIQGFSTDLKKTYPTELTPQNAPTMIFTGTMAHNQRLQEALDKQPDTATPDMKNAKQIARLRQAQRDGSLTPEQKDELDKLEASTIKGDAASGLEKGQQLVDQRQSELDAIANKNSPAAKRAQEKLDQAKADVQKQTDLNLNTKAGNAITGVADTVKSFFSPSAQTAPAPTAQPGPINPFQAELNRRKGNK